MSKFKVIRRSECRGSYTPAALDYKIQKEEENDNTNITPYRFQRESQLNDDVWENTIDIVCSCEKAPNDVTVQFTFNVRRKIDILMTKFKSQEWLAYLVGKEDKLIEDLYIPKQHATTGNVSNIDTDIPDGINIIGVIHSHHGMGAFFSGTDDDFINKNYNLSIVVSHKEMKGQFRFKLPCGSLKIVPVKVQTIVPKLFDEDAFYKDIDEKINPSTSQEINTTNGWHYNG